MGDRTMIGLFEKNTRHQLKTILKTAVCQVKSI